MKTPGATPAPALAASAVRIGALIPRSRLHPAVVAWAEAASRRVSWAVGFSGGPDSLALLLLLWAHWPERRRTLRALHFDHRLRGVESTEDVRFCRKVCRALGITFITGKWIRPKGAAIPGEAQAREARLAFFQEHARVVWLGQQQDDIAESMLMRLARGSGLGGLAAPRPVQRFARGRIHLRPLLTLKKAEIVAALRDAGIAWREDSSNAAGMFFRNRIRHEVIPSWIAAAQRDALAGAARSRALLAEDEEALEGWLDEIDILDAKRGLRLAAVEGKPRAIVRRALHRWLQAQRQRVDISSQAFEALLVAVEAGKPTRHSLGAECFGVIREGSLRVVRTRKTRRNFQRRTN